MTKYKILRQGSAFGTWVPIDKALPKEGEDYGAFLRSVDVLTTDGHRVYVAYLQTWEDDEYPAVWKMIGRDGYTLDNITHWMPLPTLP